VGFGSVGTAERVGIDGEYWLSKNVGIGPQFGYQVLKTFSIWPSDNGSSVSENRVSLAPAVTIRGNNPANFPIISAALGYSWGHSDWQRWCDSAEAGCTPSNGTSNASGLYGSLTGAWLFHPRYARPTSVAFALGPLIRVDWLTYHNYFRDRAFGFESFGVTFTTGLTIGFGVASRPSR
jgi:hypothetical protein